RNMLGRVGELVILDNHERALEQSRGELELGLQNRDARSLGPHQGASDVETSLGQQLVEVEARNSAGQLVDRVVALADQLGIAIAKIAQLGVNLTFAPSGS